MGDIETCDGYKKLLESVERDEENDRKHGLGVNGRAFFHDYRAKLAWVLERAKHYAEKTGLKASDILDAWEKTRDWWYMNYYQDCRQPLIEGAGVRVFETQAALLAAIGKPEFRCPLCSGVSKSPYRCDSGVIVKAIKDGKDGPCNWNVGGLLGDLGKGVYVFVKSEMAGERIFMPLAWENVEVKP